MRPEPQTRPLSLYIVAAEESGDALGAALVRALQARHGGALTLNGVGGRAMAAAGLAWTMSQAEERGERFLSLFRPVEFDELLRRSGFSRVEEVGPRELIQTYLAGRPDAQLTGIERLATAWV